MNQRGEALVAALQQQLCQINRLVTQLPILLNNPNLEQDPSLPASRVLVSDIFANVLTSDDPSVEFIEISDEAFCLQDSVIFFSNNDTRKFNLEKAFLLRQGSKPKNHLICWDFDNHHWLENSIPLARLSDIYLAGHLENFYLLRKVFGQKVLRLPTAVTQWSEQALLSNIHNILTVNRKEGPYGSFVFYPQFEMRNRVIAHLAGRYTSVRFVDGSHLSEDPTKKLLDWASYKTHVVIPTSLDVPIRLWDALISGGIPIVPRILSCDDVIAAIPKNYIVFYDYEDLFNFETVVETACDLFDKGGYESTLERVLYALSHHHINSRFNEVSRKYLRKR
jgi:hypothetical protein